MLLDGLLTAVSIAARNRHTIIIAILRHLIMDVHLAISIVIDTGQFACQTAGAIQYPRKETIFAIASNAPIEYVLLTYLLTLLEEFFRNNRPLHTRPPLPTPPDAHFGLIEPNFIVST
jgi:hypothetical protein